MILESIRDMVKEDKANDHELAMKNAENDGLRVQQGEDSPALSGEGGDLMQMLMAILPMLMQMLGGQNPMGQQPMGQQPMGQNPMGQQQMGGCQHGQPQMGGNPVGGGLQMGVQIGGVLKPAGQEQIQIGGNNITLPSDWKSVKQTTTKLFAPSAPKSVNINNSFTDNSVFSQAITPTFNSMSQNQTYSPTVMNQKQTMVAPQAQPRLWT